MFRGCALLRYSVASCSFIVHFNVCACLRLPFFFSVVQDVVFFSFAFVCFVISSLFTFFLFLDSVISLNCCRFCDYLKLLSAHLLLCFFFFVTRRSSPFSFFRNSKTGGDVEDMPVPAVSLSRCCCCCFFFLLPLLCSVFSFWCTAFCDHHNSNGNKSKPRHRPSFSTSL